ncbi:hypothetical protein ACDQ55_14500 [Chitinophaga sp. 30R24]|uniref:hypothetical protein n=1 Tax=Chitinophaga sp. 30R24 TaxID=3248838 RepID=UPI003B91D52A
MTRIKTLAVTVCLTWLLTMKMNAQVVMSVQVPPAGLLQQSQLWNLVLTSTANTPLNAVIAMRLMDATTGQPVLNGITRSIALSSGARQLQLKDVSPVTYEYLSPVADRRENALLPPGRYSVCYSLIVTGDKSDHTQSEQCLNFVVEPVAPPQLNSPANTAMLESSLPQFTWIPPAPLNLFADLNYDMVLVALEEGQSAVEAVQSNMAVYRFSGLRQPFLPYPAGAPALDSGITYAWMITANNGRQYAAQTDVWTFRVKKPANVLVDDLTAFVELRRESGPAINSGKSVKCTYVNDAGDATATYEIIALEENNRVVRQGQVSLQPGANMMVLPLQNGSRLSSGKTYLFRLMNKRSENWEMKFIYTPSL